MEKKVYETPKLTCLGSVQELTAQTEPVCGSVELTDFSTVDRFCEIENV